MIIFNNNKRKKERQFMADHRSCLTAACISGFSVLTGIISAVKRAQFVGDRI
jgi:hypothetical protein